MEKNKRENLIILLEECFYALTAGLVIFVALEIAWPGIVLAYININWVLILWLIIGIVFMLNNSKTTE